MLHLVNCLQKLDFYLPGFEMSAAFTYQLSIITITNSNNYEYLCSVRLAEYAPAISLRESI